MSEPSKEPNMSETHKPQPPEEGMSIGGTLGLDGDTKREELVCRRHDVYYDSENKRCVICEMRAALARGGQGEVHALALQWENIADARPTSFEFTTRDDAFRYCANQLRAALRHSQADHDAEIRRLAQIGILQRALVWSEVYPGKTGAEMRCWLRDEVAEIRALAARPASTAEKEPK